MSIDQLLQLPSYLMLQLLREARRIARNGLRGPHVTVLAFLSEQEAVAQKRISDGVRMDPSDLVSVLDDLEQRGFAQRRRDERAVILCAEDGDADLRSRSEGKRNCESQEKTQCCESL